MLRKEIGDEEFRKYSDKVVSDILKDMPNVKRVKIDNSKCEKCYRVGLSPTLKKTIDKNTDLFLLSHVKRTNDDWKSPLHKGGRR